MKRQGCYETGESVQWIDIPERIFAVLVEPLPAGVTQLDNFASIADDGDNGSDPNPDDNSDSDTTPLDAAPNLVLSKDDGGVTAAPGGTVSYTLSYQNIGEQDATGVVLTETVPANTVFEAAASTAGWICSPDDLAGASCTLAVGSVAAGEAASTATFVVRVDKPLAAGTDALINGASIADDGTNGSDPDPDDNSATDGTPIEPGAALFTVYKAFSDGNPMAVEVTLVCDAGLVTDSVLNVSQNQPATFELTNFEDGMFMCTIAEQVPGGYSANYSLTPNGGANQNGCVYEMVKKQATYNCFIEYQVFVNVPTMNRFGLAILALLMLGLGLAGTRRRVRW